MYPESKIDTTRHDTHSHDSILFYYYLFFYFILVRTGTIVDAITADSIFSPDLSNIIYTEMETALRCDAKPCFMTIDWFCGCLRVNFRSLQAYPHEIW